MMRLRDRCGPIRRDHRLAFFNCNMIFIFNVALFGHATVKAASLDNTQTVVEQNNNLVAQQLATPIMPVAISEATSGIFGTCNWDIDADGKLTIHAGTLGIGQGNWIDSSDLIKSIYVEPSVVATTDSHDLFALLTNVETIDVTNLDVSNVKNFEYMFRFNDKPSSGLYETTHLTSIVGLDNWDTSNALSMHDMFANAYRLSEIDVSNFDTSKVYNFSSMFRMTTLGKGNNSLTQIIGIDKLDTSNATDMNGMFYNNANIANLDVSHFDTSKVTNMKDMFTGMSSLENLDVSNFDTQNVLDMAGMFNSSISLKSLDVSNFKTENVTTMGQMFNKCSAKITGLQNFDMGNVTIISGMLTSTSLENTDDIENWDVSNVSEMSGLFSDCKSLTRVDISKWNKNNVTLINSLFTNDVSLTEIKGLDGWDTSKITNMNQTFSNVKLMTKFPGIENWDTSSVTNMGYTFSNCTNLTDLDLSHWDTSKVQTMQSMFSGDTSLNENGFKQNFNTSNVTVMMSMFSNVNFKVLDLSNFDTSKVTDMSSMFSSNQARIEKIIGNFDTSKVIYMSSMFMKTTISDWSTLNIADWNTSKVKTFDSIFNLTDYTNLDVIKDWDTSSGTDFRSAFKGSRNLYTLDLSNWVISANSNADYMFDDVPNLWKITLGPKVVLSANAKLNSPTIGAAIIDPEYPGYKAISNKWQEIDRTKSGSDHDPKGALFSTTEIIENTTKSNQSIRSYVWQQQEYRETTLTVPEIDYGTVGAFTGTFKRKDSGEVTISKYSYPTEKVDYNLTVSMDGPLTTEDNQHQLPGTLIYRDSSNHETDLSETEGMVYSGVIGNETKSITWDDDHGILLKMTGGSAVNGIYKTTLDWTLTSSL